MTFDVPHVLVGGREVWREGAPTEVLGRERTGRFLRAGQRSVEPLPSHAPAPSATPTS